MAFEQFYSRLSTEMAAINAALYEELARLPRPCQPVGTHIMDAGGKRLRPFLTVITARMFGCQGNDIYHLASSLEMLHAATLLHDDVLDQAVTRRGKEAAHVLHGINQAILGGDALLALGNAVVSAFDNARLTKAYSIATMETAAGEVLEMASMHNPELTHDEYLAIAAGKTGCLIAQACVMGALAANASDKDMELCRLYGENLGTAFQLVDDALDFAPESQTGKPTGGDLREGKMTPPLRLYRESLSPQARQEFDQAFRTGKFANANEICASVSQFITASLNLADGLLAQARTALASLPQNTENAILAEMLEYVRQRQK